MLLKILCYLESQHFLSIFGPTRLPGYVLAIEKALEALAGNLQTN